MASTGTNTRKGVRLMKASLSIALGGLAALVPQGCSIDDILEVNDPDIVIEIPQTPGAAIALMNGTFRRLAESVTGTQGPDGFFMYAGLLADEWRSGDTFVQRNNQDQRIFEPANTFNQGAYRNINRVRVQATITIDALRRLVPSPQSNVGLMFTTIAYVEALIAEHYCNGTPLSEPDPVTPGAIIYGEPLTNDSVFGLAIAHADSALANRAGSADSNDVEWFASIVKARAQVARGQYAASAATIAAAGIPDNFKFLVTHSLNVNDNQIWGLNNNARRYTLVNREGVVGLDFVAGDPRLPTRTGGSGTSGRIFDTSNPIPVIRQGIYGRTSGVPIASGIEARVIEAEERLQAADFTAWLSIINALRTNASLYPPRLLPAETEPSPPAYVPAAGTVLPALAQPANDSLRIYTHFRERALWLFSTGHRLGDMRRLVRPLAQGGYGWVADGVFPTGPYFKGGSYSTALQMSVPFQEQNNPRFVQCLNLNP